MCVCVLLFLSMADVNLPVVVIETAKVTNQYIYFGGIIHYFTNQKYITKYKTMHQHDFAHDNHFKHLTYAYFSISNAINCLA